jgi:hypothetical protein
LTLQLVTFEQRTPLSKQRNKRLQTTLIEAAKIAPRYSPTLAVAQTEHFSSPGLPR